MGWLLLLAACVPEAGPVGLAPTVLLQIRDADRSELADGAVLTTVFRPDTQENWVLVIGGDGRVRLAQAGPPDLRALRAHVAGDGESYLTIANDPSHTREVGVITRLDWTGEVRSETGADWAHHDFVPLSGNRFAYLEHVIDDVPIEPLPGDRAVATDGVRIVAEGSEGRGQALFDFFADYPTAPWWVCDHMEEGQWLDGLHEWTHSNAVVAHPTEDALLVLPRYLDAIVKIDAATGEVLWQLSGRDSDFALGEGAALRHPHFSHAWDDRILVFDNGEGHGGTKPAASRVVELLVDEVARTAEAVWTYEEPEGRHLNFLGDARRLPGGNTLIGWGPLDAITEVTPDGQVVWQAVIPDMAVGRVTYLPPGVGP